MWRKEERTKHYFIINRYIYIYILASAHCHSDQTDDIKSTLAVQFCNMLPFCSGTCGYYIKLHVTSYPKEQGLNY